jgi:hypothetical protein
MPTRMMSLPAAWAFLVMNWAPETAAEAATAEFFKKSRRDGPRLSPDAAALFILSPFCDVSRLDRTA